MIKNPFRKNKKNRKEKDLTNAGKKLKKLNKKFPPDSPEFTLNGWTTKGNIIDVYDGDTVTAIFGTPFTGKQKFQWKCRIVGIDTPEIRTRNKLEKKAGLRVRDYLQTMVTSAKMYGDILFYCLGPDKYGRQLVTLVLNGINVADHLIQKGYALQYGGDTKRIWTNDMYNAIIGVHLSEEIINKQNETLLLD